MAWAVAGAARYFKTKNHPTRESDRRWFSVAGILTHKNCIWGDVPAPSPQRQNAAPAPRRWRAQAAASRRPLRRWQTQSLEVTKYPKGHILVELTVIVCNFMLILVVDVSGWRRQKAHLLRVRVSHLSTANKSGAARAHVVDPCTAVQPRVLHVSGYELVQFLHCPPAITYYMS